jgi:hypothetical protein
MFQYELSVGPSEAVRLAPLSDLTNVRSASTDFHHATVRKAEKIAHTHPTLICVLQIPSSIETLHSHDDLHDDFWSDTDIDIDSESPLASNDSIFPVTSTEKTVRTKTVCQ